MQFLAHETIADEQGALSFLARIEYRPPPTKDLDVERVVYEAAVAETAVLVARSRGWNAGLQILEQAFEFDRSGNPVMMQKATKDILFRRLARLAPSAAAIFAPEQTRVLPGARAQPLPTAMAIDLDAPIAEVVERHARAPEVMVEYARRLIVEERPQDAAAVAETLEFFERAQVFLVLAESATAPEVERIRHARAARDLLTAEAASVQASENRSRRFQFSRQQPARLTLRTGLLLVMQDLGEDPSETEAELDRLADFGARLAPNNPRDIMGMTHRLIAAGKYRQALTIIRAMPRSHREAALAAVSARIHRSGP